METAFIFVILGTKTVRSDVPTGVHVRRHCPACGMISEMREQQWRNYFTVFFIPLFPISRGQQVLVCSRCQSAFPIEIAYQAPEGVRQTAVDADFEVEAEKTVINCRYCNGELRVPLLPNRTILVTCPHCRRKFEFAQ